MVRSTEYLGRQAGHYLGIIIFYAIDCLLSTTTTTTTEYTVGIPTDVSIAFLIEPLRWDRHPQLRFKK